MMLILGSRFVRADKFCNANSKPTTDASAVFFVFVAEIALASRLFVQEYEEIEANKHNDAVDRESR